MSQVLLHAIRPAYYYNDFKFLGTVIEKIGAETVDLERSVNLLGAALRYHVAADDYIINTTASEKHVAQFENLWITAQLLESQKQSFDNNDKDDDTSKVDSWYRIVNTIYSGMCFEKMAGRLAVKDKDSSYYREKAYQKFRSCIDMIRNIPDRDNNNNIDYEWTKDLWLGFAYRNWGKALCQSGKSQDLRDGLKYLEIAVNTRKKVLNVLNINAIGGDLGIANAESAQGISGMLFSQYFLEIMIPMVEMVKFKLLWKEKDNENVELSNYDYRRDIRQFIHIISDDRCYHYPYIVRRKICAEMKELFYSINDAELQHEFGKLIRSFRAD